jgi:hypothetical protein
MTKSKTNLVNTEQLNLFDLLQRDRNDRSEKQPGRMCISARLLNAVKKAVKEAPMSRETLADTMTELSGREVTASMISNWTAESHPHQIPAELIPALCVASGCNAPIIVQNDAVGIYTVDGPDRCRAEIQRIEEARHKLSKEKAKYQTLLEIGGVK